MADTAALQTELDELKAARHKLLTGTSTVEVRYAGRVIVRQPADLPAINARIRELEVALGKSGRRAPIGVSL